MCKDHALTNFRSCSSSVKILTVLLPVLKEKHYSFKDLVGHKRTKRGWFDGIGTTMKILFGTMSHDDAIKINNVINTIEKDDKKNY